MVRRGLVVHRAGSIEEAHRVADGDPMHAEGLRTYELRAWLSNGGTLTISPSHSTQTLAFD